MALRAWVHLLGEEEHRQIEKSNKRDSKQSSGEDGLVLGKTRILFVGNDPRHDSVSYVRHTS